MSIAGQNRLRVMLYEGPGAEPLPPAERHEVMSALLQDGYWVSRVRDDIGMADLKGAPVLILGRFGPGSSLSVKASAEQDLVWVRDLSGWSSAAECRVEVERVREESQAAQPGTWRPWFPVIDFDRCTQCMQCLSFCLFGVYGVDAERHIEVQKSEQCKTNCPACSRVCPEVAIIFPKYKAGPINGDEVGESDLQREKVKIDISALLGGDVYQVLRVRSERAQSRFAKERDPDKALRERQNCLQELIKAGDIPPEVLTSLPAPDEIQRRVRELVERARMAGVKLDR